LARYVPKKPSWIIFIRSVDVPAYATVVGNPARVLRQGA